MNKTAIGLCVMVLLAGCYKAHDERVQVAPGVRSDSLGNNIITRPLGGIVSFIIGEGIVVSNVKEARTPEGFLEVQVSGYNQSMFKKRFEYKAEWLDGNGMLIDTVMSKWMTVSVTPKSTFTFKVTSPTADSADFRINTRIAKNLDK